MCHSEKNPKFINSVWKRKGTSPPSASLAASKAGASEAQRVPASGSLRRPGCGCRSRLPRAGAGWAPQPGSAAEPHGSFDLCEP